MDINGKNCGRGYSDTVEVAQPRRADRWHIDGASTNHFWGKIDKSPTPRAPDSPVAAKWSASESYLPPPSGKWAALRQLAAMGLALFTGTLAGLFGDVVW